MFKQAVYELLDFTDFISFINMDRVEKEIDKLSSIDLDITIFEPIYKESTEVKRIFEKAYETAYKKTDRQTYQAMEAFVHNLNTMHSRAGAQVPFLVLTLVLIHHLKVEWLLRISYYLLMLALVRMKLQYSQYQYLKLRKV